MKDKVKLEAAKKGRNATSKLCLKAKRRFVVRKLEENRNNHQKFWKEVNNIMPKGEKEVDIKLVDETSGLLVDEKDVAGKINDYFTDIGKKLSEKNKSKS